MLQRSPLLDNIKHQLSIITYVHDSEGAVEGGDFVIFSGVDCSRTGQLVCFQCGGVSHLRRDHQHGYPQKDFTEEYQPDPRKGIENGVKKAWVPSLLPPNAG
jgi:hypothetical protein